MDNERYRVWTVGEEATFTGQRQAAPAILSRLRPHAVIGEPQGTGSRGSPQHVDRRLGMRVDIRVNARKGGVPTVDQTNAASPVNLDRDCGPSGQTVGRQA